MPYPFAREVRSNIFLSDPLLCGVVCETFTFLHRRDFISKPDFWRNSFYCRTSRLCKKVCLHSMHLCCLWWQRKVDVGTQTVPSHCQDLPTDLYILTLCCHLPWHDLMHSWLQEERLKGETTVFIWYVTGQVMAKHLKQGHCEKCKITSPLMVRKIITNCILSYIARKYASIGQRSTPRPGWKPFVLLGQ